MSNWTIGEGFWLHGILCIVPELPEVESIRRLLQRTLGNKQILSAEVAPDEIVLQGLSPKVVEETLVGAKVKQVGRKGKYWWLELDRSPWLFGHLGMSGWIRALPKVGENSQKEFRLKEHGNAPLYDETGRPRFCKLLLTSSDGERIAFTDGRRLGRLWLAENALADSRVSSLGPDALSEDLTADRLADLLSKRKAPIKPLLMDQKILSGIGNWVADEVLYKAKISPKRAAYAIEKGEWKLLFKAIREVLQLAVDVEADYEQFPKNWLFHVRWGGSRGSELHQGELLIRETVGGRTTAWVPSRQR